jgi:type II secretion system protein I
MKTALNRLVKKRDGFTLIEVIIALAILVIVAASFLHMYVFSASVTGKSEKVLDATYLAQNMMEKRYADSKKGENVPEGEYFEHRDGYWVHETIRKVEDSNLVNIIIKVYSDESRTQLEAQMETYLLWMPD